MSHLRFPTEPNARERLSIEVQRLLSRSNETGRQFHVNGITVITTARTAASAEIGAIYSFAPDQGTTYVVSFTAGYEGAAR